MKTRKPKPQRWKGVCAYDGGGFGGWQSQPDGRAVQDVIERRLREVLGRAVRIHGSGRTDAGVHALGQVFHFDAPWAHGPEALRRALQSRLPPTLQLRSLRPVRPTFHARFSAKGKIYRYEIHRGQADPFRAPFAWSVNRPLNWDAMREAARRLVGRHDFGAFAAENGAKRRSTVRQLRRVSCVRRGRRISLTYEGDGFLFKMARSLTGTLVNVGLGKLAPAEVAALLKSGRRTPLVQTAPPHGLVLVKVLY